MKKTRSIKLPKSLLLVLLSIGFLAGLMSVTYLIIHFINLILSAFK